MLALTAAAARPFAKAAFAFALEKAQLKRWNQMLFFVAHLVKNQKIKKFLEGTSSASQAAGLLTAISGERLNENCQNLIRVMAEKGYLASLPEVYHQFLTLQDEYEKVVVADIASVITLSKEKKVEIIRKLEARLSRRVRLNCAIDKSLLGGIVVRVGSMVIDESVRGRLSRLSNSLQH